MNIADNSSLTLATNSNATTSYVFYHGGDGSLKRLSSPPTGAAQLTEFRSGSVQLVENSKMAAAWPDVNAEGPLVFYQTNANEIRVTIFGADGSIMSNSTIV